VNDSSASLLDQRGLPRFDLVRSEQVEPSIRSLLADLRSELEGLEAEVTPTWEGLVEPIERLVDRLAYSWGIVRHLMGVQNSEALRAAHDAVQSEVVRFEVELGQSAPLYAGLEALRAGPSWAELDAGQRRVVETLLLEARLSGVGLEGASRERFNEIQTELAELATQFQNHVLDATKAWSLTLRDTGEVAGLPRSLLELTAQSAREAGEEGATPAEGPWRVTLDEPCFVPFMQHARRRDLRERVHRARLARASEGEFDNSALIERILALRREEAELLGFASFAELSLATKMAPDLPAVESLLEELYAASIGAAKRDLAELEDFARAHPELESGDRTQDGIAHWDVAFWTERLREERFAYTDEELRPYLPLPRVLEGLFGVAERLFDVEVVAADGQTPVWHEDVRFFRVRDRVGVPIAGFFLDPYSRPAEKRGGAWMDECVGRSRLYSAPDGGPRLPVAYIVCNQTPPVDGRPSLMSFGEVETLFHEFGHGLQHMLTTVGYGLAAGIRGVEWDAVELPSQFMENWCYHRETLLGMSGHYETGEPLSEELFTKIRSARTYRAGSAMLRQLMFGFTDLELHHRFDPDGDETPFDVQRRIGERTSVLPTLPEDRFLCSFGHIFAGGYAAGYYSYKWAEVLSADTFAAFEEEGLDDAEAVAAMGRRFRDTVLALGGSRPAMDVFVEFRGRKPETQALLRHSGLSEPAGSRADGC
jgi:oligopeptidase A